MVMAANGTAITVIDEAVVATGIMTATQVVTAGQTAMNAKTTFTVTGRKEPGWPIPVTTNHGRKKGETIHPGKQDMLVRATHAKKTTWV
jgi:hypothetical protein